MKKLLFLMTALMLTHLPMRAEGGTCGANMTWDFTDGTLTISGTGEMDDFVRYGVPWEHVKGSIYKLVIEEGVTHIDHNTLLSPCEMQLICRTQVSGTMCQERCVITQLS